MDISGQQQMGVTSRIVQLDLDENHKPVNMALSSVLYEVFAFPVCNHRKTSILHVAAALAPLSQTSAATRAMMCSLRTSVVVGTRGSSPNTLRSAARTTTR